MRTLTANAQALLNQNMGTEMVVILEVQWTNEGALCYSDQELDDCIPSLITMGGFDTSLTLEGSSDSQEVSVTLDDTDGAIREIYRVNDVHKRPASIYMLHKGQPMSDRILIFKGEVVTPFVWAEGQRAVTFSVMSSLSSVQAGFAMEEGDFPNIPSEALGKAWPLVFGQICHMPAVKVRAPRRGYLQSGVGISDFTLPERICQATKIQCPSQQTGTQTAISTINGVITSCQVATIGPDLECVNRRYGTICQLKDLLDQQREFEFEDFDVYNGVSFPQGESVTIYIDGAQFVGAFSGNTFTVNTRVHPDFATFDRQICRDVPSLAYGTVQGIPQFGGSTDVVQGAGGYYTVTDDATNCTTKVWIPTNNATTFTANQTQAQAFASCDEALIGTPGLIGGPKDSWAFYDEMEASNFFWAPAGSEVYVESESEILYMVSLLPGVVTGVAAFRTAPNGFRYLTEVPTDLYTVYLEDYTGYQVVQIGMERALSTYNDQWEDQIYVSFTSTVGPNPCDTIQWLVEKYTDLEIDSASFASVASALTNYPANFYLTRRVDTLELIHDIAYQSRCAIYVRNGVMFISYLAADPTSEKTLTESDFLVGTFVESLSPTEDVYTTHEIGWKTGGAAVRSDQPEDRKVILKYNVSKYNTVEDVWDYYTLNLYDLVLKTATFWLIRKSSSWRRVDFQTTIKHLDLDVGDAITIDMPQFSADPIKVVIDQMAVNPDDYTITFSCWTPVRSGEDSPFYWAWPSQQSAAAVWPLAGDTAGGAGYNFTVTPPVGSILLGGEHRDDQLVLTTGDLHPSDLDDTLPEVICELADFWDFDEIEPAIAAKEIAQSAARSNIENNMTGGGNPAGMGKAKKDDEDCGHSSYGCNYKVTVTWHTSHLQGKQYSSFCGGPCGTNGGCMSCTGPVWTVCHTVGVLWAATALAQHYERTYGKQIKEHWNHLESGVLRAVVTDGVNTGAYADDCPLSRDGTGGPVPDGEAISETLLPTGMTGREGDFDNYQED